MSDELLGKRSESNRFDAVRQRHALNTCVDNEPALRLQIVASDVEAALDLWRQATSKQQDMRTNNGATL